MTTRDFLPVPPIETATEPIHSVADLDQRWRALMGPLGFAEQMLHFVFVGPDRRMVRVLSAVPLPQLPQPGLVADLMAALRRVLVDREPHTTVAFLLTRPGLGTTSDVDRRWSALLVGAAADVDVPIEPVFLATNERVVLVDSV